MIFELRDVSQQFATTPDFQVAVGNFTRDHAGGVDHQ